MVYGRSNMLMSELEEKLNVLDWHIGPHQPPHQALPISLVFKIFWNPMRNMLGEGTKWNVLFWWNYNICTFLSKMLTCTKYAKWESARKSAKKLGQRRNVTLDVYTKHRHLLHKWKISFPCCKILPFFVLQNLGNSCNDSLIFS